MDAVLAGHGRTCITPPIGVQMMGYGARTEGARGIHDELFVNAVALRADRETVALVAYDLCFFDLAFAAQVKAAVEEATDLDAAHVVLNCSHTHAGPAVGQWHRQAADPHYEKAVVSRSVEAVRAALDDASEARLWAGDAPLDIGCNRRQMTPDGQVTIGVNPQGPRLPEVTVWRLSRADRPDVVLFSTPMHGTVLGGDNLLISSEWMGAAARCLEAPSPDLRSAFLQGCGADQNPYRENATFETVDRHGRAAAEAVTAALQDMRPLRAAPIRCLVRRVPLPLTGDESSACPLPLHVVRIGEALLIGLGCEPFVEYALFGRRLSPGSHTFVLGYTDGSVGYLPTADAYEAGGYETVANQYFPVGKPFVPRGEQLVREAMRAAVRDVTL
jgi:hypothetical protein